ncbi:MAG: acyltransferase family protein [Caldilineaceae bacterium]
MSVTEVFYTQPSVAVPQEAVKTAPVAQTEELTYVKTIRAFALLVIVTLHVAFPLIYLYNTISYGDWWIANNFYIWGKIGSPLFTMVSGLLLLNPTKDQPIGVFFRKRFAKVLLPFVAWSLIYLLWRIFIREEHFTPKEILVLFVQGPVYYHLWFIQMILGLYLATPILRIYIRHTTRQNLTYFLLVWLVTVSVLPITKRFFHFEVGIDVAITTGYVGFFVLGYYLRDMTLKRRQVISVLLIIVTSLLFTQYATHALTVNNGGAFDNFFVLNDSLNLIIVATGLFLLLKSIDYGMLFQKLPILQKLVLWISSCSLGVYFVHVLIIDELASGHFGFTLMAASFHPLLSIPSIALLVMALSVCVTMVLKQVPYVRNIVP